MLKKALFICEKSRETEKTYLSLLNKHIPGKALNIQECSQRIEARLKTEVSMAKFTKIIKKKWCQEAKGNV